MVYNDLLIGFAGLMDSAGRWYNASYGWARNYSGKCVIYVHVWLLY